MTPFRVVIIMRHRKILEFKQKQSERGKIGQRIKAENRLANALEYEPHSYLVFELYTHNPRSGTRHHIEIKHEIDNGNERYNIYLNGEKWRNSWSKTRFADWLFKQIDSVRVN